MSESSPLDRLASALADRYRIMRELGSGGMATVYLAHDVRHDRDVAIKVLRSELAAMIGAERFLGEIKTTAKLQHPNILPLLDSGDVDGSVFYAMPYVDGESLRQRITREKQLSIPDAVRIATEVAAALDYAHRHGVIHRDIKPENILLQDRRAVVADFGIALAVSRSDGGMRITETGMSLGTPQYMSPEQAMGERNLDARTDIYALGCVLYEMLAGEPPFTGPTAQVIVAKAMHAEPEPVTTSRKTVPPNVVAATMTALHKVPADRFATAGEFAAALENPAYRGETIMRSAAAPRLVVTNRYAALALAVVALIAAALGSAVTWLWHKPAEQAVIAARFELPIPDSLVGRGFFSGGDAPFFPTNDGRLLWYESSGLYERPLDTVGARLVLRTTGLDVASIRDVSPDGSELLVLTRSLDLGTGRGSAGGGGGRGDRINLNAVPLNGGPRRVLADSADFAVWGADGYVYYTYFWPTPRRSGLARIRADGGGGKPDTLATFNDSTGAIPQNLTLLPKERGIVMSFGPRGATHLVAFDLRDRSLHQLGSGGPKVAYVEPGYLLFASGPSIMAAPFDLDHLTFSRPATPLITVDAPTVRFSANGGVLVYRASGGGGDAPPLAIRNRHGDTRPLPNAIAGWNFSNPAVSPDGKRFAVAGVQSQSIGAAPSPPGFATSNIFIYEFPSGPMTRLSSPGSDRSPTWLPEGREIGFIRLTRDTLPPTWSLMRRPWDGSGDAKLVYSNHTGLFTGSWMPDGRNAVVWYSTDLAAPGAQNGHVGLVSIDRPDSIRPLAAAGVNESIPVVSPDGRLLAYQSNESGSTEIYVRSMSTGERRQVSLTTGGNPRWGWSGHELFFTSGGTLMSAEIRTSGGLSAGAVKPILTGLIGLGGATPVPAPLPGDSLFVAWAESDALVALSRAPVVVLVNLGPRLERLFATPATP